MTLFEWFRDYNKKDNVNQIDDREVLCKLPSISLSNTAGELHTKANVELNTVSPTNMVKSPTW